MARLTNRNEQEIENLLKEKDAKSTKKATKHSVNILREFCQEKGMEVEFEKLEKEELDNLLKTFYANARRKDGSHYTKNSMNMLHLILITNETSSIVLLATLSINYRLNVCFSEFWLRFCCVFSPVASFETWYIIKHLLTDPLGKHHVLWTLDHHVSLGFASGKHWWSRVHKT